MIHFKVIFYLINIYFYFSWGVTKFCNFNYVHKNINSMINTKTKISIPDSYVLTDVREDRTCQIWKSQIQMPWTMVEPLCTLATEDSKTYSTHTFQKILRITEFKKLYGTNQCKKWHKWESGTDESRAHVIMKWLSWCIRSNK